MRIQSLESYYKIYSRTKQHYSEQPKFSYSNNKHSRKIIKQEKEQNLMLIIVKE